MGKGNSNSDEVIKIKKFANRWLYNSGCSSYITLDDLTGMTKEGVQFRVVDAKSGDDITHSILTQIIMEEEANGAQLLPISFLRDLISMYGNSMESMMPSYLEASMKHFRDNQAKIKETFQAGMGANPLARMAESNMAMIRAMGEAFIPDMGAGGAGANGAGRAAPGNVDNAGQNGAAEQTGDGAQVDQGATQSAQADQADDQIAALREQMAAMQKQLDQIGKQD